MEVSQRVLEGRAAMIEGNADGRRRRLHPRRRDPGQEEEGGDPPIIWYPTRRSLAAAMLANGDAAGAKAKIEELLTDWPMDPYSYFVLAEAEAALGNTAAAEAARAPGAGRMDRRRDDAETGLGRGSVRFRPLVRTKNTLTKRTKRTKIWARSSISVHPGPRVRLCRPEDKPRAGVQITHRSGWDFAPEPLINGRCPPSGPQPSLGCTVGWIRSPPLLRPPLQPPRRGFRRAPRRRPR